MRNSGRVRRAVRLVACCVLVAVASVATGCETTAADQAQVVSLVNASRAQAGLPPVRLNGQLSVKADRWAQRMRNVCRISHSRLADGAPAEWRKLGENVGEGASVAVVHTAYMNSPGHRANVLDRAFRQIGTAAVWGDCGGFRRVFTVHVFMA